jgi:hypothetical protein
MVRLVPFLIKESNTCDVIYTCILDVIAGTQDAIICDHSEAYEKVE